jgi:hypothetical protein
MSLLVVYLTLYSRLRTFRSDSFSLSCSCVVSAAAAAAALVLAEEDVTAGAAETFGEVSPGVAGVKSCG